MQVARTYGEKCIGDFNREDMTKLVELMAKWRLLLGVTSESSDQELIVICQFVYDNFKKYTLSDINLAMNWTISGKIEVQFVSQKTLSSYYVSKAINAYDAEKREIVNEIAENRNRHLIEQEINNPKPLTQVQKANYFREFIVSLYKSYTEGGLFYDVDDSVYNWLKSQKMINPKKEEIAAAMRYAEERYKQTIKGSSFKDVMEQSFMSKNKEEQIKKFAREFIVMQIFEFEGLPSLINKIKPEQF